MKEAKEMQEVKERPDPRKLMWVAIWAVAITVTLIGGSSGGAIWRAYIQLPGIYLVLSFGFLLGPFGTIMSPLVVEVLTILTNVLAYFLLVKMVLFFVSKLKSGH
jgi:hypothetical protein